MDVQSIKTFRLDVGIPTSFFKKVISRRLKKTNHFEREREASLVLQMTQRSTVQNVRFDVGSHLIVSAAVALDRRATIRRIFGTDVAVADLQRRRSESSAECADTPVAAHFLDDARFLPIERSNRHVMVLLFGRQIVRTGWNARLTAADDHSESTQVQLAVVPVKAKQKANRHQNDAK